MGNLPLDAEHVPLGNRHLTQERFVSHPIVAVRVVWRNAAFVAKRDLDTVPRERIGLLGKCGVNGARRVSPGKTEAKQAGTSDGLVTGFEDERDGVRDKLGGALYGGVYISLHGTKDANSAASVENISRCMRLALVTRRRSG